MSWLACSGLRRQCSLAQLPYNTIQGPNQHGGLRGQGLVHEHLHELCLEHELLVCLRTAINVQIYVSQIHVVNRDWFKPVRSDQRVNLNVMY